MFRLRSEDYFQLALIGLGTVATVFFGVFFYREVFPEYRIYQDDYYALEKFRSTYTGQPPPAFKFGVQQIVIPRDDKGPEIIDRCISCHVALKLEHFSPTKIEKDMNGNIVTDANGIPVKIPNENYVFKHLNEKILSLRDKEVNQQLEQQGDHSQVQKRLKEAEELEKLTIAKVDDHIYQIDKVLAMHPLMGRETRPFEYHAIEEIGCTVCHSGNGRGLTTEKAHGPVYTGQYGAANEGPEPTFTEADPDNDPIISKVFNYKPNDDLTFQTTPLLVNNLIQAKCVQCHNPTPTEFQKTVENVDLLSKNKSKQIIAIQKSLDNDQQALLALLKSRTLIQNKGIEKTLYDLNEQTQNFDLPTKEIENTYSQINFLKNLGGAPLTNKQYDKAEALILSQLDKQILNLIGSKEKVDLLQKQLKASKEDPKEILTKFLEEQNSKKGNQGSIFEKLAALNLEKQLIAHVKEASSPLKRSAKNSEIISGIQTDVDVLTKSYQRGQELFISQACYACHRIAGFSRGGVGPELTLEGLNYPWFVKQSIVWPQADLRTSTMPNTKMDHEEIENLLTYLLAQRGPNKVQSAIQRQVSLKSWDEGQKMWWEEPISPTEIKDVHKSMIIFATQGCANCHRLVGFESNVGFAIEKNKPTVKELYDEGQWFSKLFPDMILGSQIVEIVESKADEIDKHIVHDIRKNSILEEIETKYPGTIETFYTNFKYASRAKNHYFEKLIETEKDSVKKELLSAQHKQYKDRIHRILMVYIQEYGLGRIIGPRVNWSGVYRSDQWLMEHFWKPTSKVARSIMPIFPFDNTKFLALTYMLDVLGMKNRKDFQAVWTLRGFNPEIAFQTLCSQCHGEFLQGNGPVSEWIYPIPKNLRNSVFMRSYTKDRVINSITHGVDGTPMPPWGEVAKDLESGSQSQPVLTKEQINVLADWLFEGLGADSSQQQSDEIPKWKYTPQDFIQELKKDKNPLKSSDIESYPIHGGGAFLNFSFRGEDYLAALDPMPVAKKNNEDDEVKEIFDIKSYSDSTVDLKAYYIKKKFYTPENLAKGEQFFNLNCAVCHGREGDGTGNRSGSMQDAKPRMLTNINWLESRDDLRLLRSIKYGVPGTSMTPWGDNTNALQRLQLVTYIRSLSEDTLRHNQLKENLYQTFFNRLEKLEQIRVKNKEKLDLAKSKYSLLLDKQSKALSNDERLTEEEVYTQYHSELRLKDEIKMYEKVDNLLQKEIDLNNLEQQTYELFGNQLIATIPEDEVLDAYKKMISLNNNRFKLENDRLMFEPIDEKEFELNLDKIVKEIDKKILLSTEKKKNLQAQLPTTTHAKDVAEVDSEIDALKKLKKSLLSLSGETKRIRKQELDLVEQYNLLMTDNKSK